MSTSKFLGGLLIGSAIGAFIGMLVAPRSGRETRALIRDEVSERTSRQVEDAKQTALTLQDRARATLEDLQERGNQIANELEEVGRETLSRVKTKVPFMKTPDESPN